MHPSHLTAPDLLVIPVFLTISLPITSHINEYMHGQKACDPLQHQSQPVHSSVAELTCSRTQFSDVSDWPKSAVVPSAFRL